jgi:hypothetical protein
MSEHFKDVRLINLAADRSQGGIDIYFERTENPPPNDPQVEKLRNEYEETVTVLKDLNPPNPDFGTWLNEILEGAKVGLKGPAFSLDAGQRQLTNVRNKLISVARKERDTYLLYLLLVGFIFSAVALLIAGLLYFVVPPYLTGQETSASYKTALSWIIPVCLLHPGVVLGVVFTAFAINRTITFEKIRAYDPYYFSPTLRFFYISIISYVLMAALWFKFVMLGVGGYLLNDVKTDPAGGFMIGLLCGVSEAVIVELLLSRLKPVERK